MTVREQRAMNEYYRFLKTPRMKEALEKDYESFRRLRDTKILEIACKERVCPYGMVNNVNSIAVASQT